MHSLNNSVTLQARMSLMEVFIAIVSPSSYWLRSSVMPSTCGNERKSKRSLGFRVAAKKKTMEGIQKQSKKALSKIMWTEAAINAIVKKSGSKKHTNLWPKAVLEALEDAIRHYQWDSALKIFGLLRKQHWYQPRCQTYTKLIMMLGKCRKSDQAALLFEVMLSDGVNPSVDVFTALVNAYGLSGLFDQAFATIVDMKSIYDCRPDVHTYSILLNCCVKHRRFDLVNQILTDMSYVGVKCSIVTYNTVIDGYGKAEMFDNMEHLLSEMIESGECHPDVFTLNSIIWAYGNCGQIEKMESWYEEFQVMGIRSDVRTFNILIRSYGKARMYQKMVSVLDFMKKRCYSPTVVTFNTVIDVFGRAGDVKNMDDFFLKMKHQGMKPNTVTYCTLINAYSKTKKLGRIDAILRQVANSDVVLDTAFFNCLISAYGRSGNTDKMKELFLQMKDRNCEPDHITYATMIQAYNAKGMTEDAKDTESKMLAIHSSSGTKLLGL